MNLEEIKIGETYYVRVKADSKDSEGVYCQLIDADGNGRKALSFYNWMLYSFLPVPSAPKYDPCRLFKKGDKVRPCPWRNRRPTARWGATRIIPDTRILEVASDERHEHVTLIYGDDVVEMHICHLELVTPVEELGPYYVKENASVYEVFNRNENNSSVAIFFKSQYSIEKAKERADAECARLNAEYRKEANNGLGH